MNYVSIADIERDYDPGYTRHWFDRDTMRFFKCRLPQGGYESESGNRYFVTSEQGPDGIRKYSVRCQPAEDRHSIKTVGEFQQYASRSAADRAAKKYAECPGLPEDLKAW